jgi:predicted DNA-binding protein (MmcQ/YjbR family)
MDLENIRQYCLAMPHATERVQWGNDLLFCIGEKIFAVAGLDAKYPTKLSFKCTPEKFAELVELEGIVPAPYVARYHWVALEDLNALPARDLKDLLKNAYQLVHDKLPKKVRDGLGDTGAGGSKPAAGKKKENKKKEKPI